MRIKLTLGITALALIFFSCQSPQENKSCVLQIDDEGFVQIFDGKSFNNWEGDSSYWRVENGSLVGEVTPATILSRNSFIIWLGGEPKDFELKLDFRVSENGNSGINYRSELVDTLKYALRGYQCDIDGKKKYTGQNYEERRRTTLAFYGQKVIVNSQKNPKESRSLSSNIKQNVWQNVEILESLGNIDSLNAKIKNEDWNECHLIVKGNRMLHFVNNVLMSDVTDNDTINRKFSGLIGVQVHVGPPMKIEYRNIRIKELK